VTALTHYGVPTAVLATIIACMLTYSRWSPKRLPSMIAKLTSTTHPAAMFWAMLILSSLIICCSVLFLVWGIRTVVLVTPRVLGVGILLLLPCFAFVAWAVAAWRASGWAGFAASPFSPAASFCGKLLRRIHPISAAVTLGMAFFTGYELSVVYNGDTVTVVSGTELRQSYVHR
jgi:hypothetical protein